MESFQWRSHASSIIQETARFYRFGVYVDCCLLVEGKRIKAHKLILAAASAYFQVLFMTRRGESHIRLDNVKYDDAKSILDFIYEGVVDIPQTRVASFMKTAQYLQIRALIGYLHKNVSRKKRYDGSQKEMSNMLTDVLRGRQNRHFKTKNTPHQGNTILCDDNGVELSAVIQDDVLGSSVHDPKDVTFTSCEDFQPEGQLDQCESDENVEKDIGKQSTIFRNEDWLGLKRDYQRKYASLLKMRNELCADGGLNLRSKCTRKRRVGGGHRRASRKNDDSFLTNSTCELKDTEVNGSINTNGPNTQSTNVLNSPSSPLRLESLSGKSKIPNSDDNDTHVKITNTGLPHDTDSQHLGELDIVLERFSIGPRSVKSVCDREQSNLMKSSGSRDVNNLQLSRHSREQSHSSDQSRSKEEGSFREQCLLRAGTKDEGSKNVGLSNPSQLTKPSHAKVPHRLKESSLPSGPQQPENRSHLSEPGIESATLRATDAGTSKKTISSRKGKKKRKRAPPMEKTGTGDRPYKCPHCPSAFKRSTHCKAHIRTHTGSRPYKCNFCQKAYAQEANLIVHVRRHKGEKPFVCPHCQKAFTLNCALQDHILRHTGEKPHKCSFCHQRFRQGSTLKRHIRKHTKEKPFGCNECNTFFSFKSALIVHLRTHTGEKPFECSVCGKFFIARNSLSVHMRSHTGEKPYKCEVCNKGFTQVITLRRHLESIGHKRNQTKEGT